MAAGLRAQPPQQGQLDSSPALFAVLAALHGAGFDADMASPANHPARQALREYLAQKKPAALEPIRQFVREHRQANAAAELSQYISLALCLEGPPEFKLAHDDRPLPPDAEPLAGLIPLLKPFWEEAQLDNVWRQLQPFFNQQIEKYQQPVLQAVLESNSYLRVPSGSTFLGRRFQIYLDILGPPHQLHSRNYGDDTFVVLTATFEPPIEDIRRAYLQYALDPIVGKFAEAVRKKRGLGDYSHGSPILDAHYKEDFVLLTVASLVRAVESRLSPAGSRQAMVDQALKEGFVVTPALAELLPAYEKQDRAMRLYFPELIAGIDLKKEERRLADVAFVSERPARKIRTPAAAEAPAPVLTGAEKTFDEAEKLYKDRNLPDARAAYLRALQQTDRKDLHAKAYYGLARVAALLKDPELADKLFRKVLELEPDSETKSWSLLYLARLADSQKDGRHEAESFYRSAMEVEGAPEAVKQAAARGLKEAFVKKETPKQ